MPLQQNIPIDDLKKDYCINKLSMYAIGKKYRLGVGTIHRIIHRYGLDINKRELAWNSGKTYHDDNRILAKEKHPRYKNGIGYNSDFFFLRNKILPCKCNRCENIATLVHHKDNNKHNNDINNLEPLCSSCHTVHHNKRRGVTIYKHICENPECLREFTVLSNKKCNQKCCSLHCKAKLFYLSGESPLFHINAKKSSIE